MPLAAWFRHSIVLVAAGLIAACGQQDAPDPPAVEVVQVAANAPIDPAQGATPKLAFNAEKAHFDYQMNCQGCHGSDGAGNVKRGVPSLDDLDRFLKLPEGRDFLVRVPGMSRSPLSDADLTNLANWMMEEFGGADGTMPFEPFEEAEVAQLRNNPIVDGVVEHRAKLVARLDAIPRK